MKAGVKKKKDWGGDERREEFLRAAVPPDALVMSKVSRSVSPLAAIKEAPWSSQHVPCLFITSVGHGHSSHRRPCSNDMQSQAYLLLAGWRGNLRVSWLRTGPRERSLESTGWRSRSPPQRSCRRERQTRGWLCAKSLSGLAHETNGQRVHRTEVEK